MKRKNDPIYYSSIAVTKEERSKYIGMTIEETVEFLNHLKKQIATDPNLLKKKKDLIERYTIAMPSSFKPVYTEMVQQCKKNKIPFSSVFREVFNTYKKETT